MTSGIGSPVAVLRHAGGKDAAEAGRRARRSDGSIRCCVPTRRERRRPDRIHRRTVSGLQLARRAASGTVSICVAYYNTWSAEYLKPLPTSFRYAIQLQRMEEGGKRALLVAGGRRELMYAMPHDIRRAPDVNMTARPEFRAGMNPTIVGYRLRREVYAWFGFDEDAIPYVIEVDGERATDVPKLIEDGRGP